MCARTREAPAAQLCVSDLKSTILGSAARISRVGQLYTGVTTVNHRSSPPNSSDLSCSVGS
eukprot:1093105-Pyramimonas_sp.AAC.3